LFREGGFSRFVDNLAHIPHADHALIIRSVFGGGGGFGGGSVPQTRGRICLTHSLGRYHQYWEIVRQSRDRADRERDRARALLGR
jgi:hypothetical protein